MGEGKSMVDGQWLMVEEVSHFPFPVNHFPLPISH
jgi:hypothetical protein